MLANTRNSSLWWTSISQAVIELSHIFFKEPIHLMFLKQHGCAHTINPVQGDSPKLLIYIVLLNLYKKQKRHRMDSNKGTGAMWLNSKS